MYDAVVIGSGHNGLVAAGYLARAGRNVLILERRDTIGGACATEELFPGFRFSSCSFMLYALHPKIVRDMELQKYGFELFDVQPHEFRPFPDGRHLIFWRNAERNAEAIRPFSMKDAENYPRWHDFWERAYSITRPFGLTPPPSLADLLQRARETGSEQLFETLLTTCHADLVDEFFESEHVKGAVVHAGDHGNPYVVGSSFPSAFLPGDVDTEIRIVGIVKGGMGSITAAMAEYVQSEGASIRTGCEVRRVIVEQGAAKGVELSSGEEIRSELVVSNADPKRTFLKLVDAEHLTDDFRSQVARLKTEIAYLKFHAAMDELPDFSAYLGPDYDPRITARVWISPSVDYVQRAWADARAGRPSQDPVMSIQIPSVYDDTICPAGKHVLSIFSEYAPVQLSSGTWDDRRQEVGEALIDSVSAYAPNFRQAIREWMLLTPLDIERRVYLTDGNIHHLDQVPGQMFSRRPLPGWAEYKTPIDGLWLCGAGTHPGGEVSGAPGHNAAHAILSETGA